MYTYMGSLSGITSPVNLTKIDLGDDVTFNPTAQTVTGTSGDEYTNLINWYKGYDIANLNGGLDNTTTQRKRLGGALHSRPILINYGYTGDIKNAAKPANQTNYVFFSTLEGTLHALNANTGEEVFSFIPGEKLARLKELFINPASALPEFGMDLTWVSYRKDGDSTGQISGAKDKIWLYGGMRMGGDDYFALDVTNINAPKLMFAIDGGAAGTKYARMGQTWSEPVITSIYVEGKPQKVMIFGGGYDTKHENHNLTLPFATVDKGNQVYIVDAEKGTLLWMTSGNTADAADKYMADMKFSIPSSPKAIDLDGDGVTDVLYVGDLGGQVFRIDLDKKATTKADIAKRVVLLAKVGQTETATLANQRRFYEPPAVAMFKDTSGQRFATVVMGSGYRSRPLNTITKERFFTFFDKDVARTNLLTMPDTDLQAVITTSTLAPLDLTSPIVQQNGVDVTNKRGWYIDYPESGEKSLASGFIYSERLVFSTYSPVQSVTSNCSPVKGQTNMYVFCMPYGKLCPTTTAANGFDGYKKSNTMAGLGGEPQLMLVEKDDGTLGLTVLLGTTPDASVFSDTSAGGAQLVPIKKWREKTQKD
jgi:type IV pilus assembly protein PilY1